MNRKALILLNLVVLAVVSTTVAYIVQPFPGWNVLTDTSSGIIIARCSKTPDPYNVTYKGMLVDPDDLIESEIEIVLVLKGNTRPGTGHLRSEYWPRQGEYYAVFALNEPDYYQATESYCIVPLGIHFPTNMLAGKTVNEQIRALLQYRLDELNQDVVKAQDEKKRLEQVNN